jgi:O-antigen ligase
MIKNLVSGSFLVNAFLKDREVDGTYENSIITRFIYKIINVFRKLFKKIKLDSILDGSIFTKPHIWLFFTVVGVPFLPTMLVLGLELMSGLALFLKATLNDDFKLKFFKINSWILCFAVVVAVAAITSVSTAESYKIGLLIIAFLLFYFVFINTVDTKEQLLFYVKAFVISGTFSALYGLYQYFLGDIYSQEWLDNEMFEDIKMRVYSTFSNPNVFGEYLILVIPFSAVLCLNSKTWFSRIFWLGTFGILMLALLLTFSRGCWLGIILSLAVLAILVDKRFIWLFLAALVVAPFILPSTIMDRFMSIGNMKDSSTSYRVYIWLGTIAMLKDFFWCGIGLGVSSFNLVYPLYSYNEVVSPHSHSLYLQLFVEYGVIGFVVFMFIMYYLLKDSFISYKKTKSFISIATISAMAGFMFESATDNTWYNYRVLLVFWIVIAIATSATKFDFPNFNSKKVEGELND